MRRDFHRHHQVTRWSAGPGCPLPLEPEHFAAVNPCRDLDRQPLGTASRTVGPHRKLVPSSRHRDLEGHTDRGANVLSPSRHGSTAGGGSPTPAEQVSEINTTAEEAREVEPAWHGSGGKSSGPTGRSLAESRAEAIVLSPGLLVAEDLVGLLDLLEPFGSALVVGVLVGVELARELLVRLADVVTRRPARDSQHVVEIAISHRGQSVSLSTRVSSSVSRFRNGRTRPILLRPCGDSQSRILSPDRFGHCLPWRDSRSPSPEWSVCSRSPRASTAWSPTRSAGFPAWR